MFFKIGAHVPLGSHRTSSGFMGTQLYDNHFLEPQLLNKFLLQIGSHHSGSQNPSFSFPTSFSQSSLSLFAKIEVYYRSGYNQGRHAKPRNNQKMHGSRGGVLQGKQRALRREIESSYVFFQSHQTNLSLGAKYKSSPR